MSPPPVELEYDGIDESQRRAHENAQDAIRDGAEVNVAASKGIVSVGIYGGPHLRDSIETETRDPRLLRPGVWEMVVKAGIEGSLVAWANEAGTGASGYAPPDTEDTPPPGGGREEWVYYNEKADQFFTSYGYPPQPFMGPGYEAGRAEVERTARDIFG